MEIKYPNDWFDDYQDRETVGLKMNYKVRIVEQVYRDMSKEISAKYPNELIKHTWRPLCLSAINVRSVLPRIFFLGNSNS